MKAEAICEDSHLINLKDNNKSYRTYNEDLI
jgi:hypothetical protein